MRVVGGGVGTLERDGRFRVKEKSLFFGVGGGKSREHSTSTDRGMPGDVPKDAKSSCNFMTRESSRRGERKGMS